MKTWTDKLGLGAAVTTNMTVNGSSVMAYVMTSAHQNKSGTYHSVIYLYDKAGNCVTRTLDVQIPEDLEKAENRKLQLHVHRQIPIIIEFRSSIVHFLV